MIYLLIFVCAFTSFASTKILNGKDVPSNHLLRLSTVALVQKTNQDLSSLCTGTVIGPHLVLSAGHCVNEWFEGEIFIGSGTNPLSGKLIKVKSLRYSADFGMEIEETGDVALLWTEEKLEDFRVIGIGDPGKLNPSVKFIQAGYGYNTRPERQAWPYFGKLLMEERSWFEGMDERVVNIQHQRGSSVLGGDSGGPLYIADDGKLVLHGVLSSGGDRNAHYTHPFFALEWMNCALPEEQKIPQPEIELSVQIPCGEPGFIPMSDLSAHTKKKCEAYRPGWTIKDEPSCWPATREACLAHSEEMNEELIWDEAAKKCRIPEKTLLRSTRQ